MVITPATELDAVNEMLAAIGEAPVNQLGTGLDESAIAHRLLVSVARQVQARGWYFNREPLTVLPTTSGEFLLPRNILKVDDNMGRFVQRGQALYDARNGTSRPEVDYIRVDVVVGLGFDDLPETAKTYIFLKAARRFQERFVGSASLHQYGVKDESEAYVELLLEESEAGNYNARNNPETRAMLNRGHFSPMGSSARYSWDD